MSAKIEIEERGKVYTLIHVTKGLKYRLVSMSLLDLKKLGRKLTNYADGKLKEMEG